MSVESASESASESEEVVRFKRNHFSARLPRNRLYCLSHSWLLEHAPGHWRVGLTSFATRMLGEIVEFDFEVSSGGKVAVADVIGWIEGFKAVSDVYCAASGVFREVNPAAVENAEVICKDPYGEGWIYSIEGEPDPQAVDVDGYVEQLDKTIDKMLEKPWKSGAVNNP